ncbi:Calreticulin [Ectocarpus siliculosus]|uniref:Calreticulin n=1 Tax=Ectocarpus siliculosus TaxID=2880 RepID=D7FZD0_ECTSI|nr:Calreticulin [Ectocarpus siliculosus]|eukprot:CBJ32747.1 Calreticulin [Ectocarpus siliculosus]
MKFSATSALCTVIPLLLDVGQAKIYLQEKFDDEGWRERWTVPTKWKPADELGEWGWTAGEWYGGSADDKGIQTSESNRFYGLSAKLAEPFTNEGKDLVLQLSIKNEQKLDCGGAYIKLTGDMDQDSFGGDTPYQIMFGPDKCGTSNARTHVIFNYPPKGEGDDGNLLIKKDVKMEKDQASHLYTLHVKPDGTFEVFIDQESVRAGSLEDEFDFLAPKEIKDPGQSKPEDWVDEKKIPDPEDVKPEGYDDIPSEIPDPKAEKPEDWDEEEDGEWEPTMIKNPEYKGKWKPKMIPNPDYKGPWEHPMVPNPDYKEDKTLGKRCTDCTHVGFELWQVTAGTIFDEILVTDSLEEAQKFAEETWATKKDKEKEAHEELKKKQKEEEEAERAAKKAAAGDDEESEEEGDAVDDWLSEAEEDEHDEL